MKHLGAFFLVAIAACGSPSREPIDAAPPSGPAAFVVTPMTGAFGMVGVGATSVPIEFKVANKGADPATAVAVATSLPFHVEASTCGQMLAGGASCVVDVASEPTVAGAVTQSLDITSDSATAVMISLSTTAVTENDIFSLSPSVTEFNSIVVGQKSPKFVVTATNPGTEAFGSIVVTIGGDDPTQFLLSNDTCSGAVIQPASACMFSVTFAPLATGPKSATFTISSASGGPSTFLATGSGS